MGIYSEYMFECKCKRCQDPTELGTYYGGIYCSKCNSFSPDEDQPTFKGISYQEKPFEMSSDWKCNHCNNTFPGEECQTVFKRLFDNIQEAIANSQGSTQVMELVGRNSNKYFSRNHIIL